MDANWYTAGSLVRVNNYEFDDKDEQRDKYLIVLHHDEQNAGIIDCLTTSKSGGVASINFGCSIHDGKYPYFFFPSKHVIGEGNFYFELDTYIFFKNNIRLEPISKFNQHVAKSIFGLVKLDELSKDNLKRLIKCALKSKFVPIGLANTLSAFKATL